MPDSGVVAVIPARGGSKRIPRKNIRPFVGVPLIARTIQQLQQTSLFDHIVVSTDDDEIAQIAREAGADVPFRRDAALSTDHASTVPVIRDAVVQLLTAGIKPHTIVAVYPAAVFTTREDLATAITLLETPETDYAIPVTTFPYPIQRALRWRADGSTELFQPEHYESRSQDLEPAFHDAGQFYAGTRNAWLEERALFTHRTRLLRIPRTRVQDIDTLEDWSRAEQLHHLLETADVTPLSQFPLMIDITPSQSLSAQEHFWRGSFGDDYIARNRDDAFVAANIALFAKVIARTGPLSSVVEYGPNVGLNLRAITTLLPHCRCTGVEINPQAAAELRAWGGCTVEERSMLEPADMDPHDLSFTKGVLIHLPPDRLSDAYDQLVRSTRRFIFVAEYYSPTPVSVPYRGHDDRLFKRDFAGELMDRHQNVRMIDYGFCWRRDPTFPMDDLTWFLMEKIA